MSRLRPSELPASAPHVQAIDRQTRSAPAGAVVHGERHHNEQTTLHRLVQEHATTFVAETEADAARCRVLLRRRAPGAGKVVPLHRPAALRNERVHCNVAGQVVLGMKTPRRDGTIHPVLSLDA